MQSKNWTHGQTVQVRDYQEILQTLDSKGALEGLPFMPEMRQFCGQAFQIHKHAFLVCVDQQKSRGMRHTVFLDNLRCDGSYHDSCKKSCTIMWKEAWLKDAASPSNLSEMTSGNKIPPTADFPTLQGERYFCQSTNIHLASFEPRPLSKAVLLLSEVLHHNQKPLEFIRNLLLFFAAKVFHLNLYTHCKRLVGNNLVTPADSLNLQPKDRVRVKSAEEIKMTLDPQGGNRGLLFTPDMYYFCGREFAVKERLDKMILENSGKMISIQNTVLLENVVCVGRCKYSCVRNLYHFWREAWLERV